MWLKGQVRPEKENHALTPKLLANDMTGVRDGELIMPASARNNQACLLQGPKRRGRAAGHKPVALAGAGELDLKEAPVPTKGSHHSDPAVTTRRSHGGR